MIQKINMKSLMTWLLLVLLVLFSGFIAVSLPAVILMTNAVAENFDNISNFYRQYQFMQMQTFPISELITYFGYPVLYGVALSFTWENFKNKKISQAFMWQLLPLSSIFLAIVIIAIAFFIN